LEVKKLLKTIRRLCVTSGNIVRRQVLHEWGCGGGQVHPKGANRMAVQLIQL